MDGTTDNAEEMDMETLQAQVDLSMSFAQNMVSGWMKSMNTKKLAPRVHHDTEKEIEELMRRPPRLGVGVAVPASEASTSYRNLERLQGALIGGKAAKKRAREEEQDAKLNQLPDSEDESRAEVVKKKQKLDPFAPKSKKAKNKPEVVVPIAPTPVSPPVLSKKQKRKLAAASAAAEQSEAATLSSVSVPVQEPPPIAAPTPTLNGLPVLNLDGTFPENPQGGKKKRKRKKNKNKETQ